MLDHKYKVFYHLAKNPNTTKVAEELLLTQPAISKSIKELEKELERITKKLFDATMFNFACLMNNSYKDKETPHVHFHFIPRYDGKRIILGKKYKDKHFGYNMWKWSLSKFKCQKDIFSREEKEQLYKVMKDECNYYE